MTIDIIDIGFGNISSIRSWLNKSNLDAEQICQANDLKADTFILPGVGSAGPYMKRLNELGFSKAIKTHVSKGGRLLGICLGFQILFEYSNEDGGTRCLSILNGRAERLKDGTNHNGWEPVSVKISDYKTKKYWGINLNSRRKTLTGRAFYNHEYGVISHEKFDFSSKISDELSDYVGIVIKDNVAGVQFHPEKSQLFGLDFLKILV